MERNRRLATWTGAILGAFLALLVSSALAHARDDGDEVVEEFHQTYPLDPKGRIELENVNGAVDITAWDENQVKVDAIKRAPDKRRLDDAEIRVVAHNDSILIRTRYHEQNGWGSDRSPASVEYALSVPRNARLDEIKVINGALDISGAAGEVRASSINGRLTVEGLAGEARLSTINSRLKADFSRLGPEPIDLASVNGGVELTLPSDAKATIEANTIHGEIDNDFGLHTNNHRWVGHDLRGQLGGGGTEITLHNVNGGIDIRHASDGRALSPAKDTGEHRRGSV
ncbi:MAG: hypothetical protein J2P13_04760 [Acidobacteria bacterium]|nr:hypothetical protein [Acidobacteriota bacterium]